MAVVAGDSGPQKSVIGNRELSIVSTALRSVGLQPSTGPSGVAAQSTAS